MDLVQQEQGPAVELALLSCEDEMLKAELKQTTERLESLKRQNQEMIQRMNDFTDEILSYESFLQFEAEDKVKERAKLWQIVDQKKEQVRQLQEEIAELKTRKEQSLKMMEKMSQYHNFLEEVVKLTKFENVQALINHLENLFYIRDKLLHSESMKLEEIDKKRKKLLNLEDKHQVALVHKNYQLAQLQTELEKYRSDTRIWEQKWDKIQETAAKKTLMLGQIKMATLNLYEMTGGSAGEEGVDVNDTDTQLDKIASFIQDHENIVKQFQFSLQKEKDKKDKTKPKLRHYTPKKYSTLKK